MKEVCCFAKGSRFSAALWERSLTAHRRAMGMFPLYRFMHDACQGCIVGMCSIGC